MIIRFLTGLLAGIIFSAGYVNAETIPQIPESVVSGIVKKTLIGKSNPTEADKIERTREVKLFLESVVGGAWYKNYIKEFALPKTGKEYVAQESGVSYPRLGYYYIHRSTKSGENLLKLQCNNEGNRPSPTTDGFCGLANWNSFLLTGDKKYHDAFIEWADLFVRNQHDGKWEWSFDLPSRNLKTPWISGLTQSVGISLLLRAYQSTQDEIYLQAASNAFGWLVLPISIGGAAIQSSEGTWYEEYPDEEHPSHVLNGHMWALFGIWDYFRVTGDPAAKEMFEDGVRVIKANIDKYDVGYWAVYAQTNRVDMVKGNYMGFIIQQLKVLYAITGDPFFDKYSRKWRGYQKKDALFIHMATEEFLKSPMSTAK